MSKKSIGIVDFKKFYGLTLRNGLFVQANSLIIRQRYFQLSLKFKCYNEMRMISSLNQNSQKVFFFKRNRFLGKIKKFTYILIILGLIKFSYDIYELRSPMPFVELDPNKKTIVVLGSGWGSISLLKNIKSDDYNIIVVSPRNYFLFTPFLVSCTTGTTEFRSIIEPIRFIMFRKKAYFRFYEASCTSIDPNDKTIIIKEFSGVHNDVVETKLSYDYLVIGVGAENQTFGISGVNQYANFLKEIPDARKIRAKIMECIKAAMFEGQTYEEKKRLLHMVIVGGGPTGVEFAAELRDFFQMDLKKWFPEISNLFKISLFEALPSILPMFSKTLVNYTEATFREGDIGVFTRSTVKSVTDKYITVETTTSDNKKIIQEVPYGLLVWATGNSPRYVIKDLMSRIPEQSNSSRGLLVNDYLVVKGTENIWALGDCTATKYASTAQVASQQGYYLAKLFDILAESRKARKEIQYLENLLKANNIDFEKENMIKKDIDIKIKKLKGLSIPLFEYSHKGTLAYIGNDKAIADLSFSKGNFSIFGITAFLFWRSVYINMLFLRNKVYVCFDWIKASVFGRDLSSF